MKIVGKTQPNHGGVRLTLTTNTAVITAMVPPNILTRCLAILILPVAARSWWDLASAKPSARAIKPKTVKVTDVLLNCGKSLNARNHIKNPDDIMMITASQSIH